MEKVLIKCNMERNNDQTNEKKKYVFRHFQRKRSVRFRGFARVAHTRMVCYSIAALYKRIFGFAMANVRSADWTEG